MLGHSASVAGLALAAFAVGNVAVVIPSGRLSDRIGRKPLLITGLSLSGISTACLGLAPSLPVSNLHELIAYAKSHPGELNFASTGSGTANHLAVEMLGKQADIKVTTVFYKGSAEGIADVLGGRTHGMVAPASTAASTIAPALSSARSVAVTLWLAE